MSRRRAGVVREQLAGVAAVHVASRGPCPGQCNAAYRRLRARWEREVLEEVSRARAAGEGTGDATADLTRAQLLVRGWWEDQGLAAWPARDGRPVWCLRCASEIRAAVSGLPRVMLLTLETGWSPATRPDGSAVTDPVLVLSTSDPDSDGRVVEVLSCGHRNIRPMLGLFPLRAPGTVRRVCRTCVVTASVPEPGRLAPAERAARLGPRQPVSPAGSPAWVEVDAAVEWVCSAADKARFLLGASERMVVDTDPASWPWRSPSTRRRLGAATRDARFLEHRLDDVLALPTPVATSIGVEAVRVSTRLREVSGMAIAEHAVEGECPREGCGRRGLVREDGGEFVHCRACGSWWNEEQFEAEQERRGQEQKERARR